jgi:hypothetical protein
MVYQDHGVKLCALFPLPNKTATVVAKTFLSFFFVWQGAPSILQSNNGTGFVNSAIDELALTMA